MQEVNIRFAVDAALEEARAFPFGPFSVSMLADVTLDLVSPVADPDHVATDADWDELYARITRYILHRWGFDSGASDDSLIDLNVDWVRAPLMEGTMP